MTLPSSGPLSASDIAAEYGLASNSRIPADFYGKPSLPAAGPVSFSDFYGKSNILFTPSGGNISASGTLTASLTITCNQPAVWTYTIGGSGGSVNIASGATATSITFNCSAGGSGQTRPGRTATFTVQGVSNGVTSNYTVTVETVGNQ